MKYNNDKGNCNSRILKEKQDANVFVSYNLDYVKYILKKIDKNAEF